MDANHQSQNLKNLKHFIRSHQKTTKFLLSVSVFSIFFSQSTFHSNFSTLPVKLITHTIDKNFMFLFCNGLLVLLAKYSRLTTTTTTTTTTPPSKQNLSNDDYLKRYDQDAPQMRSQISLVDERMVKRNGELEVEREDEVSVKEVETEQQRVLEEEGEEEVQQRKDVQQEEEDREEVEDEQEEQETAAEEVTLHETLTAEEEEEEEEEEEQVEEGEEKEEASAALLSTEELNKKFDEFIRKMKEELRIEARYEQQLIMV